MAFQRQVMKTEMAHNSGKRLIGDWAWLRVVRRAVPRSARKVNHIIKLIFIGLERVRLKGRERMLHSFRREDENLKFDIIFQAKLFTMCLYFCVSVFVFLCRAMQIIIQRRVIRQLVFQVFSVPNKKNHSRNE